MSIPKITEIIPSDIPAWAQKAIDEGNFFRVAIEMADASNCNCDKSIIAITNGTVDLCIKAIGEEIVSESGQRSVTRFIKASSRNRTIELLIKILEQLKKDPTVVTIETIGNPSTGWQDLAPALPKGASMPMTEEYFNKHNAMQDELIMEQKDEISKLKSTVNDLTVKLKNNASDMGTVDYE